VRPQTIAIDGPAGSGKSTIGYALADRLNYAMLDTGILYRLVALSTLTADADGDDESAVVEAAEAVVSELDVVQNYQNSSVTRLTYRSTPITELELHTSAINEMVPRVSRHPSVRSMIKRIQRQVISSGRTIVAGRDIGTVVVPEAELKLYLDVSLKERVARQMWTQPVGVLPQGEIGERLAARDAMDKERKTSPLRIAGDALVVRTDKLSVSETVDMLVDMCDLSE
jgi:cytidylate kinase